MSSVLAEFDAESFEKYVKKVSYEEGYSNGYSSAFFDLYIDSKLSKDEAILRTHLTPEQFDQALAEYKANQAK